MASAKGRKPRARKSKARTNRNRGPRRSLVRYLLGMLVLPLLLAAVLGVLVLDHLVRERFSGAKWALPTHVYSRPLELYAGLPLARTALLGELDELGYRRVERVTRPGQFAVTGSVVEVYAREFHFPEGQQDALRARIWVDGRIDKLADDRGRGLPLLRLEPVRIGGIYPEHAEDRILLRLEALPPYLADAVIAVEDRDFYQHHGLSPRAILRALWANVRAGGIAQGGSTITQQLVKNFYLDRSQTLARKAMEAVMAVLLERHYSKAEILEAYLNEIHLGQAGRRAIHGFGMASEFYFRQPVAELDLHQVALLVGMAKGASYYNPRRNPERALARRNLVLDTLVQEGIVGAEEARRAARRPLDVTKTPGAINRYPDYLDLVRRHLQRDYAARDLTAEGLRVFTHMDPRVQQRVERALEATLEQIERDRGLSSGTLQGAAVVARVGTAEVLALVGGRRPEFAGFNRALDARRSIGSTAKAAVYLAALEQPERYTLGTLIEDAPLAITSGGKRWSPENFDRVSHGLVPLYHALSHSYNQATARLGLELGVGRVAEVLRRLGYSGPLEEVPALLLGAVSMTPLEVTGVYHTIAAEGFYTPLRAIASVGDAQRQLVARYGFEVEQRFRPRDIYLLQYGLRAVMREGTGSGARLPGDPGVAGKTGTSNDQRDSWFAGFSGNYLTVVWIGRDDNRPTPLTGSSGALRAWTAIMAGLEHRGLAEAPPESVVHAWYDPTTGAGSAAQCAGAIALPFAAGFAPEPRGCGSAGTRALDRVRGWLGLD